MSSFLGFQIVSRDNPLANVKSLRVWMQGVPRNDAVAAMEAIVALLQTEAPRADGSVARLEAIMELDRLAVPLAQHLRSQYRLITMSDDVRQRLFRACDGMAQAFSQAYGEYAKAIEASDGSGRMRTLAHGVYSRMFHYLGVLTRLGLFRYEQWIPGRWRGLHQSYIAARTRSLALEPYALSPRTRPADIATAEQEYIQILLLHRLNAGNLTTPQIDSACEWLAEWAPALRLAPAPEDAIGLTGGYWLDIAGGGGLSDRRQQRAEGEWLFLDMEPFRAQLKALIGRLSTQSPPARNGAIESDDALTLAKRLDRLWQPQAPAMTRRGERRAAHNAVTVAAGWSEIIIALVARHARSSLAPAGYHYDDYGRLRNNSDSKEQSLIGKRADRFAWHIADSSESGYCIRSSSRQATRQWPGALLALQIDDVPGWQLAVVRRLKRIGADLTEVGVEIISRNIAAVTPREIEMRDSGYSVDGVDVEVSGKGFQALYLPPQIHGRVRAPASLVIPPAEFVLGRRLSVTVENRPHAILLASPLERTREWVWAPLRSG